MGDLCILHGYLLDGSGSNLWTRSIIQALCRGGESVHLVCQERHPELYDFIAQSHVYGPDGQVRTVLDREVAYAGRCILHRPQLGDTLPVYVWDRYDGFDNVVPMVALPDDVIEDYLERNVRTVMRVVGENEIAAIHANHAVLMSVVAERASRATSVPYAVMPHGSAIEYAVKKDARFFEYASGALQSAKRIFVIGKEIRQRVKNIFPDFADLEDKMMELNLGVDTSLFEPVPRSARAARIASLGRALSGLARGKTAARSDDFRATLRGDMRREELLTAITSAGGYTLKAPDADAEAKLAAVDWSTESTLIFIGRLIVSKGLQSVIAALPLILDRHPDTRLLVVGHGPLREAAEALVWALQHGERELVANIVGWGRELQGEAYGQLTELRLFYDALARAGRLDDYFAKAKARVRPDSVIFTGYLTHRELRYVLPCCDVAIFPSTVAEAGPLVFLEAIASGCFPLGTYFAGMGANIDAVGESLPAEDVERMKLSADPKDTVADIVINVPRALALGTKHQTALRRIAVERYDWQDIAAKLAAGLR